MVSVRSTRAKGKHSMNAGQAEQGQESMKHIVSDLLIMASDTSIGEKMKTEIRECVICGTVFESHHYKVWTCCEECRKEYRKRVKREYERTPERKLAHKMYSPKGRELQRRIEHQQDTSVWITNYGERQKQGLIEQYARVNVQEILGGLKL